jgi:hypothetical protein
VIDVQTDGCDYHPADKALEVEVIVTRAGAILARGLPEHGHHRLRVDVVVGGELGG